MVPLRILCIGSILFLTFGFSTTREYEKCTQEDCAGKKSCVTVYQDFFHEGWHQCYTIEKDECVNLDKWWWGVLTWIPGPKVSSIDTHGTCIRLFERANCRGSSVGMYPYFSFQKNLLFELFDDSTMSISSCERPRTYACMDRNVFSQHICHSDVGRKISRVIDFMTNLTGSDIDVFTFDTFALYRRIVLVAKLFNAQTMTEILLDAKVESSVAQKSAVAISANFQQLMNHLEFALVKNISRDERIENLVAALSTCEDIAKMFEDNEYCFSKHVVVSSPFLTSFASIYYSVLKLMYQLRVDMGPQLLTKHNQLRSVVCTYRQLADMEKSKTFACKPRNNFGLSHCVKDLTNDNCINGTNFSPMVVLVPCLRCAKDMIESAQDQIAGLYNQVLNTTLEGRPPGGY